MSGRPDTASPAAQLARRVAKRLAEAGVVRGDDVDALARRLAAGDVSQKDWEALVDGASLGTAPAEPPF